jgi:Undecaprenyl-phosphate glucose phosphotransferase
MNVTYGKDWQDRTSWQRPDSTPLLPKHRWMRPDIVEIGNDLLILWDFLAFMVAGYVCTLIYSVLTPSHHDLDLGALTMVGALLGPVILYDRGLGSILQLVRPVVIVSRITLRLAALIGLLLAIGVLTKTINEVPRSWVVMWAVASFAVAIGGRFLLLAHIRSLERHGLLHERIAIVGSGDSAKRVAQQLLERRGRKVDVIGIFSQTRAGSMADTGATGSLQDLLELGKHHCIDSVILTPVPGEEQLILETVFQLKSLDVAVALCPDIPGLDLSSGRVEQFSGLPMLLLSHRPIRRWGLVLKALEDKIIGGILLLLVAPLMLLAALAVRLDSPGPVLFRQKRTGFNNGEFEVLKFRTMTWDPAAASGMRQTQRKDSRVTRVGYWLRRTSLDELPQLLNVLRGDMSLVGPRPHPVAMRTQDRLCDEIMTDYGHRHRVKPGITGWAQIRGHRGATVTVEQVRRRVECDIFYIDNWSILLDLKILALTPIKVVFDNGNAF